MFRVLYSALLVVLIAVSEVALARISFATGVMALTNSTTQGGEGAQGSTFLTQTDFTYHGSWWGTGIYAQYDRQGANETDTAFGPRLEATLNPFYVEYGYAMRMTRAFTDRSVAAQQGKGWVLGVGVRFSLGDGGGRGGGRGGDAEGGVAGAFLQFSYKYRTQEIDKQDNRDLDETIVQTDGYPLFGIGYGF